MDEPEKRDDRILDCEHDWRGIDTGRMCAKCGKIELQGPKSRWFATPGEAEWGC